MLHEHSCRVSAFQLFACVVDSGPAAFICFQVVYRFAPAGSAYGRGYLAQMDQSQREEADKEVVDCGGGGAVAWPEATVKGMTPEQRYDDEGRWKMRREGGSRE